MEQHVAITLNFGEARHLPWRWLKACARMEGGSKSNKFCAENLGDPGRNSVQFTEDLFKTGKNKFDFLGSILGMNKGNMAWG